MRKVYETKPPAMRKIIYAQYRDNLREVIKLLCKYKSIEILEGYLMTDYMQLVLSILPKLSGSSFMSYLKRKSAR